MDQSPDDGDFDYGSIYFRDVHENYERLVIGATRGHVNLMEELCSGWSGNWYALYVLVISRTGRKEGRYQSQIFEQLLDLQIFNGMHQDFIEGDGRHHYWIGSTSNEGNLVFDEHNVIFAYGDLDAYEEKLKSKGFKEERFWFPVPHRHHYHATNDQKEDDLFEAQEWELFPLQEQDRWD